MNQELSQGMPAPTFCLPDQDGKDFCLKDKLGKWLILYFYPKDNTSGCTLEAMDFSRNLDNFHTMNAEVIGVSPDSAKSHCNFIAKHNLQIRLLSDTEHKTSELYSAWGKKKLYGKEYLGVFRSTFLINPLGILVYSWKNVKVNGHADEIILKLKELTN